MKCRSDAQGSSQQGLPLVEEEMVDMADDRRCAESCLSCCAGFAAGGGMRLPARLDLGRSGEELSREEGPEPYSGPCFQSVAVSELGAGTSSPLFS